MKYMTLLMTLVLLCCGSKLKVTEVTSQKWAGGQYQTGKGTNYVVKVKAKASSDKFKIDGLWVNGLYIPVSLMMEAGKPADRPYKRGEELSWQGGPVYRPDDQGTMVLYRAKEKSAPVEITGAGVVQYTLRGKTKYQEFKEIKELEMLIYP